jgi:NAD(P)-dependent dehydrogenase (short-subunit alcohol dehydrogenase family)
MHILIMGASRGIGLATARAALERGHTVRAFSRSAGTIDHPMVTNCPGDALSQTDVERAVAGSMPSCRRWALLLAICSGRSPCFPGPARC